MLSRLPQIAQRIVTMVTINEKVILSNKNSIAGTPVQSMLFFTFEPAAYQYTLSTRNYNTLGLLKPASCKLLKYISEGLLDKCTGGYLLFGDYRALQFLWLCLCLQRLALQRLSGFCWGGGGLFRLPWGRENTGGGGSSACNGEGKTSGGGEGVFRLQWGRENIGGGGGSSACNGEGKTSGGGEGGCSACNGEGKQQQQQTFKVWQPQRAARSKRPNTPSDGSKHNGFQTTNQAVLIPKHVSRQDRAHDQEHHPLLHRLQWHGKQ